ncbi:hypothetical protein ABZX77_30495 [Streptomyces sp. NPDC004237]|uniref:hypothetical protein n=1 Tax=Streptomyces sp. NPDC004237 TaxID=3154455 RepID=UPI0033B5471E
MSTNWTGDEASYLAAHKRIYRERGKASGYACAHCGDPASQWAYDREDLNQKRTGPQHAAPGIPYSCDPAHYVPLCRPCHARFDWAATKAEKAAS